MNWKDVMVTKERNKDLLREAEKERLIQLASTNNEGGAVWQKVKAVIAGMGKNESATEGSCISSLDAMS